MDLPVSFQASALPFNWSGTPQQFLDALVARLSLKTPSTIVFVGSGNALPTTNQGPFLLNGITLYVWDSGTGAYIPEVLPQILPFNTKPFRGDSAGAQTAVFGAAGTQFIDIILSETFDPDNVFSGSTFTAPDNGFYQIEAKVGAAATAGTPTGNTIIVFLKKNGLQLPKELTFLFSGNELSGRTYPITTSLQLAAGDTITLAVQITITGGTGTWTITQNDTHLSGFKIKSL